VVPPSTTDGLDRVFTIVKLAAAGRAPCAPGW